MPLRPLRLGDLVDGSVRIIRRNAGATVGAALIVSAIALLIPAVTTVIAASLFDVTEALVSDSEVEMSDADLTGFALTFGSWVLGFLIQTLAIVIVSGMCAHVTLAAVAGRTMSLREAWAATRGHRWRLVFASALVGLASALLVVLALAVTVYIWISFGALPGIILGLAAALVTVATLLWLWIRVILLLTPVVAVEGKKIGPAVVRAISLSRGHFWRLLGISLLVLLCLQVVASLVTVPLAILGVIPSLSGASPSVDLLAQAASQGLAVALTSALITPFSGVLSGLFLVDLRMRKEAFDVELLQTANGQRPASPQPGASAP